MNLTKSVGFLASACALTVTCVSLADTGVDKEKQSDLEARLDAAEARILAQDAKIEQLTSASSDKWLTEKRADEVRSLVQDVLADADTRSSLMSQGVTAGYDNGAVLGSSDGNWLLRTNIHMQQRAMMRSLDNGGNTAIDESRRGFENTRTKFMLSGHVVNPDWFYRVDINVGSGTRANTLTSYIGYDFGDGMKVKIGTTKGQFLREDIVESQYQLAVERSLLNNQFTVGYTQGVTWSSEGESIRWSAAFTDGQNRPQGAAMALDTEFAATGRVEYLASGTWGQFDDFTSPQGSENGMMFGGAFHFEVQEYGESVINNAEMQFMMLAIDGSFEGDGWNAMAQFIYGSRDNDAAIDSDPWGLLLQGGMYFNETWEGFIRYEYADSDLTNREDLNIITIGVNKYFAAHNAKWTTDIVYGLDEIDATFVGGNGAVMGGADTGLTPDAPDQDGQIVLRTQISILF